MTTKQIEQKIIENLDNIQYRHTNGLLESIVSQANEEASIVDITKEYREGEKMYNTVRFASGLNSNKGIIKTEKKEVTRVVMQTHKVDKDSMKAYLREESTLVTDLVAAMLNSMLKSIDLELIDVYESIRGNNSSGVTKPIEVAKSHLSANFEAIVAEFFDTNINNKAVVVGGSTLDRTVRMLHTDYIDELCFTDSNMNSGSLGAYPAANDWLAYAAGSIKLLEITELPDYTSIVVPMQDGTEFKVPIQVTYDEDSETYNLILTKFFDLFVPYMDEYGVNQLFRVRPNLDMLV